MAKSKQLSNFKPPFFAPYNLLASWFGCGYSKYMPGTVGSLGAFPLWFLVNHILESFLVSQGLFYFIWIVLIGLLFRLGVYVADIYSLKTNTDDASAIVIDEVVGQLIALLLGDLILSFVLFRVLDITKPSFIGRAEKKFKGGMGIMFDDVLAGLCAGLLANLVLRIVIYLLW